MFVFQKYVWHEKKYNFQLYFAMHKPMKHIWSYGYFGMSVSFYNLKINAFPNYLNIGQASPGLVPNSAKQLKQSENAAQSHHPQ